MTAQPSLRPDRLRRASRPAGFALIAFAGLVWCAAPLVSQEPTAERANPSDSDSDSGTGVSPVPEQARAAAERPPVSLPLPSPAEQRIRAALDERIEVDFVETPLRDVLAYISDRAGVPILVDERSLLDDLGVSTDNPVTFRGEFSLRATLQLMLESVNPEITFFIENDAVQVTSVPQAEGHLVTRLYPVGDLVAESSSDAEPDGVRHLSPRFRAGQFGGGSLGAPLPLSHFVEPSPYQNVINTITQTVAPHTWDELGGPGSIEPSEASAALAIRQTHRVHDEVETLLTALRDARDYEPDRVEGDIPLPTTYFPPRHEAEQGILAALEEPVTLDFDETPLHDVLDWIEQERDIPISVREQVILDDLGIGTDETITVRCPEMPLRAALERMLRPHELGFVVDQEVLQIATIPWIESRELATRVYPVADLVDVPRTASDRYGFYSDAHSGWDRLLIAVTQTIEPDMWEDLGGVGVIESFPVSGSIVVRQVRPVHDEIAQLLASMREARTLGTFRPPEPALPGFGIGEEETRADLATRAYSISDLAVTAEAADELVEIITTTVAPDSWTDDGGEAAGASIRAYPNTGVLIVTQTAENHQEVDRTLTIVREARRTLPQMFEPSGGFGGADLLWCPSSLLRSR